MALPETPSTGVHFQRQEPGAIPEAALEDFLELDEFRRNVREFDAEWPQVSAKGREGERERERVRERERERES